MKKFKRRLLLGFFGVMLSLVAFVGWNTSRNSSRQIAVAPLSVLPIDINAAAARLAAGVRIPTISYDEPSRNDARRFAQLHELLERSFPVVHRTLVREVVNGSSLLYTWRGSDPALPPALLLAHQDVVPISPGTENDWLHDPFGGVVADGYLWGRGAWDDKGNLFAMLEAAEILASQGYQPLRTIYFAFGHDEEIGGGQGASAIAALLRSRGVHPEFVLDEGLLLTEGMLQGIDAPVALVGIAEKGYATLEFTALAPAGHASMPPGRSAIGSLSAALDRLQEQPVRPRVPQVVQEMFETLAPEYHGAKRIFLSNLWLFEPAVQLQLEDQAAGRAMLRTTKAFTVLSAGDKDNVIPARAQAKVNYRLLPGDTVNQVLARARAAIAGEAVGVELSSQAWDPPPVSSTDSPAYRRLARTVREVFPGAIVAPGLMIAATDSRHYTDIAQQTYRFTPVRTKPVDLARFHGTNERISLANYAEMIRFYRRLLELCAMAPEQ